MEEIKKEFPDADCELIRGGGGIYDIKLGDALAYSKQANDNQFPEDGHVVEKLKEMST